MSAQTDFTKWALFLLLVFSLLSCKSKKVQTHETPNPDPETRNEAADLKSHLNEHFKDTLYTFDIFLGEKALQHLAESPGQHPLDLSDSIVMCYGVQTLKDGSHVRNQVNQILKKAGYPNFQFKTLPATGSLYPSFSKALKAPAQKIPPSDQKKGN